MCGIIQYVSLVYVSKYSKSYDQILDRLWFNKIGPLLSKGGGHLQGLIFIWYLNMPVQ